MNVDDPITVFISK